MVFTVDKVLSVLSLPTVLPVSVSKDSLEIPSQAVTACLMSAQLPTPALILSSVLEEGAKNDVKESSAESELFATKIPTNVFANLSLSETQITFACPRFKLRAVNLDVDKMHTANMESPTNAFVTLALLEIHTLAVVFRRNLHVQMQLVG